MTKNITHPELKYKKIGKIVFASFSKRFFYLRYQVSAFILLENATPFNPYMNFEYNLSGIVDKNLIRIANNSMMDRVNELWVFGDVSDGVLVEIFMAKRRNLRVRYFIPDENINNFKEIVESEVKLEDVSAWMWECLLKGGNLERWHPRLRFQRTYPLVYPAYSKRNFYWQMHISKFCIEKYAVPLNPFMLFRYFLNDLVPREKVYRANSDFVRLADSLWSFGEVSNGVEAEIDLARQEKKEVRHFKIIDQKPDYVKFRQIQEKALEYEI